MDCGNRSNMSAQALVDAGMKENDVISCDVFFSDNIENHEGRGSSCVMGKILFQWVLFNIEM